MQFFANFGRNRELVCLSLLETWRVATSLTYLILLNHYDKNKKHVAVDEMAAILGNNKEALILDLGAGTGILDNTRVLPAQRRKFQDKVKMGQFLKWKIFVEDPGKRSFLFPFIGRSKEALGMHTPFLVCSLSFPCSFRQIFCKMIG